ncbi:MAG: hypothetical protein OXH78_02445 [Acidimicrobiaceae bacterium]|nr:hypothetical protein [Acidimicrobiaceae bacterium]
MFAAVRDALVPRLRQKNPYPARNHQHTVVYSGAAVNYQRPKVAGVFLFARPKQSSVPAILQLGQTLLSPKQPLGRFLASVTVQAFRDLTNPMLNGFLQFEHRPTVFQHSIPTACHASALNKNTMGGHRTVRAFLRQLFERVSLNASNFDRCDPNSNSTPRL